MSFLKSLFGGRTASPPAPRESEPVEYKGYLIRAAPFQNGAQYQTAGIIEKTIEGVRREHRFIRADSHGSLDDATAFTLSKARQIVDLQGDRMFE